MSQHYPSGHFGPNHSGIAEVLDFALSDACFGPTPPPGRLPPNVRVVRTPPDPDEDGAIGVEGNPAGPFDWLDFLELRRADYFSPKCPTMGDGERWEVTGRIGEALGVVERHLHSKLAAWRRRWRRHSFDSLVVALLSDVALSRAFVAPPVPFWEAVFQALRAGAIPVGWSGRWPAGWMIVYLPSDPSIGGAE
jgi:hypothetical protein